MGTATLAEAPRKGAVIPAMANRRLFVSQVFLGLIASIFGFFALCYFCGTQTVLALTLRSQARKNLVLSEKPVPMAIAQANTAPGMKLVHSGMSFEVPWADLDLSKSRFRANIAVFTFQSGRTVEFLGPDKNADDLLTTVQKSFGVRHDKLQQLFGPGTMKSNYALQRAILEQTPDEVSPFTSRQEAVRSSMLLVLKSAAAVGGETGLFDVRLAEWKGFQWDDPSKNPKRVTLELYNGQDRHLEIIFYPGKVEAAALTQADVNRALKSLRFSEDPQTIPASNEIRRDAGTSKASSPSHQ